MHLCFDCLDYLFRDFSDPGDAFCEYSFSAVSKSDIGVDFYTFGKKGDVGYIHISPLLPFQVVSRTKLTHILQSEDAN